MSGRSRSPSVASQGTAVSPKATPIDTGTTSVGVANAGVANASQVDVASSISISGVTVRVVDREWTAA